MECQAVSASDFIAGKSTQATGQALPYHEVKKGVFFQVAEREREGWRCNVTNPAQIARYFCFYGLFRELSLAGNRFRRCREFRFTKHCRMPVAGTGEEIGRTPEHVRTQDPELVAVSQFNANPAGSIFFAEKLMALFVDICLLSGLFGADIEASAMARAPVANHVALGTLDAHVTQPGFIVGLHPEHAAGQTIEEVKRQVTARYVSFDALYHEGERTTPAGLREGARRTVKVDVQGFGLRLLARTFATGEETDPTAFFARSFNAQAMTVEVMTLADFRVDREAFTEAVCNRLRKLMGLNRWRIVGVRKLIQIAKEARIGSLFQGSVFPLKLRKRFTAVFSTDRV
ncbi:MAG: hypothetical protein ABS45_07585 [Comamonas sp. SCN 65-56]|nr:MAG: hypothetical protein ABS45_07585 [Comamonas sp. SCN 65-56]